MTRGQLDDLVRRHVSLTLELFARDGTVHTHGLCVGYDGRMVGLSAMLLHDFDAFPGAVRELAEDLEAVCVITVSEAWSNESLSGEWPLFLPSEDPRREEMLLIQVEMHDRVEVKLWPILRDACGTSLGEELEAPGSYVERFTTFLRRPEHN